MDGIIAVFQLLYWIFFESPPTHLYLDCQWEVASSHTASVRPVQGRYCSPATTQKQDLSGSLTALSDFLFLLVQEFQRDLTMRWLTYGPNIVFRVTVSCVERFTCIVVFCIYIPLFKKKTGFIFHVARNPTCSVLKASSFNWLWFC